MPVHLNVHHGGLACCGSPVGRWTSSIGVNLALIKAVGAVFPLSFLVYGGTRLIYKENNHSSWTRYMLTQSTLPLSKTEEPQHNISDINLDEARKEFLPIVGRDGLDDNPGSLKSRSSTEWSLAPSDTHASLIVYPQSTQQVSDIMKICHRRRIPVTGFSGGTSLDGALASTRGDICMDFSRMDQILEIHDQDLDVVVQPAVGWENLNERLASKNLFFPPDPGPGAQIGGMIGTGCSGPNAYRYGTMKDWVISTTIVLADGTIVKTRNRPRKSSAGYDLTRLIVGSAGTLGLVTEAVLKVTAKPENEQVAVIAFPDSHKAANMVIDVVQKGIPLAALEFLDAKTMEAVNQSGGTDKKWKETATLFAKFSGTRSVVQEQVEVLDALSKQHGKQTFESSSDPEEISELWSARKTALWSLLAQKRNPDDKFMATDVAVPISRFADLIEETNKRVQQAGLLGSTLGHAGDGNTHTSILYSEKEKPAAEKVIAHTQRRGVELEGTITGEHGIGLALRDMLEVELGVDAVDMMRKVSDSVFSFEQ